MKTIEQIYQELDSLFAANQLEKVEPFLISCLEQAKEEQAYGIYISVGNEMIGFYRSVSWFEKAFNISEDVLLLMEEMQLEDTEHFATTLLNVATAYRAAGRTAESYQYYMRALMIYEKKLPADDYRFAGLYNNMSILLEQMGENEKAALFLEKAIAIVSKRDDSRMEYATSLTNLALIYFKLDKASEAEHKLDEAISVFKENGENTDPHFSAALAGMGEAWYRQGRLSKALEAYEQSLAEVEKHFGKNDSYALLCGNCAAVAKQLGDHEKAVFYEKQQQVISGAIS